MELITTPTQATGMEAASPNAIVDALRGKHVVIEGNIASGKSTLCAGIRKLINADHQDEPVHVCQETTDELFLKYFYDQPHDYAFSFQVYMLKTRLLQMVSAVRLAREEVTRDPEETDERPGQGKLVLMDRGGLGDTCFAKLNWLQGKMDPDQWQLYDRICSADSFRETASDSVDCVVYLDVEPADCQHRVRCLRKTESEQLIPLEYFQGIDDMYFDMLLQVLAGTTSKTNVMVVRWGEFGTTEMLLQRLAATAEGQRRNPKVFMGADQLSDDAYPSCAYDCPEEIDAMYEHLMKHASNGGGLEPVPLDSNEGFVRIDWSICIEQKSFGEDSAASGDHLFHSNAFKRVVMYHLSLGQDVYFTNV